MPQIKIASTSSLSLVALILSIFNQKNSICLLNVGTKNTKLDHKNRRDRSNSSKHEFSQQNRLILIRVFFLSILTSSVVVMTELYLSSNQNSIKVAATSAELLSNESVIIRVTIKRKPELVGGNRDYDRIEDEDEYESPEEESVSKSDIANDEAAESSLSESNKTRPKEKEDGEHGNAVIFDDELDDLMDSDEDEVDDDHEREQLEISNPLDHRSTDEIRSPNLEASKTRNTIRGDSPNGSMKLAKKCPRNHMKFKKQTCKADEKQKAASSTKSSNTDRRGGARESRQSIAGAEVCAVRLARGTCITYGAVESAASAARRALNFRPPAGLESSEPSESSIHVVGELIELTTRLLAETHLLSPSEISFELPQVDIRRTSLWRTCPRLYRQPARCDSSSRYRSLTGACNSLVDGLWGAQSMPFARLLPADYADGVGVARRARRSGNELPNARLLSLSLHPDVERPSDQLSALFSFWGQLVNHDVASASNAREETGHSAACCGGRGIGGATRRVCMPLVLAPDDPLYGPLGVRCHEFKRSLSGLRPGCSLGPRTQLNLVSGYLDASFVYGSRVSLAGSLREGVAGGSGGRLAMRRSFGSRRKPLLPAQRDSPDVECVGRTAGRFCFQSGDARTNQQPQLAVLHTLYARQHNRLATALGALNAHWSSERLYQEARHVQAALVQHVVLSEYLPALLGAQLCAQLNLTEAPPPQHWDHYEPAAAAGGVSQAFAGAAFRSGHSSVPGNVFRFNKRHEPRRVYKLRSLFRQPWTLYEEGAVDEFLLGLVDTPAADGDPFVSADLSGHLLEVPGQRVGLDLTAINIQRGRDQGLASYLDYREWCQLSRVDSFEDLSSLMSNESAQAMAALYESVHDIDLFSGGISEFSLEGAQLGPTFACIVGRQFAQLRFGDRLWFESSQGSHAFTSEQLASIKQVSLARILCANADQVDTIQQEALRLPHPILNPRVPCDSLADLDISLWLEEPPSAAASSQQQEKS